MSAVASADAPSGEQPTAGRQRSTRQRAAVASVLQTLDDFRSAQDLHDMLRARGENVGLTTVYRTLQAMAEQGDIDLLVGADGQSLYRTAASAPATTTTSSADHAASPSKLRAPQSRPGLRPSPRRMASPTSVTRSTSSVSAPDAPRLVQLPTDSKKPEGQRPPAIATASLTGRRRIARSRVVSPRLSRSNPRQPALVEARARWTTTGCLENTARSAEPARISSPSVDAIASE